MNEDGARDESCRRGATCASLGALCFALGGGRSLREGHGEGLCVRAGGVHDEAGIGAAKVVGQRPPAADLTQPVEGRAERLLGVPGISAALDRDPLLGEIGCHAGKSADGRACRELARVLALSRIRRAQECDRAGDCGGAARYAEEHSCSGADPHGLSSQRWSPLSWPTIP